MEQSRFKKKKKVVNSDNEHLLVPGLLGGCSYSDEQFHLGKTPFSGDFSSLLTTQVSHPVADAVFFLILF